MDKSTSFPQNVKLLNTLFLLVLTSLSLYFGKERSVFFDGADWIYEVIINNNNYTPNYRYSVGVNGIMPWICSFFTKDIHVIMHAFILNYAITPILVFLLLRYYFKEERFVTLFILGSCLLHTRIFFHPNHDALTGYYYLLILTSFIILKDYRYERNYYLKLFFLCTLVVLTHLTQYIFLFIIVFYVYLYENKNLPIKSVLMLAGGTLLIKFVLLSSGYELGMYSKMSNIFQSFGTIFNSLLTQTFYRRVLTFNLPLLAVLVLIVGKLFIDKKYIQIAFCVLPLLFILYLMSFYFGKWPYVFIHEGYFKSAIIIPILIFIRYYLADAKKLASTLILVMIYSFSIFVLINHGNHYKAYYNNINFVNKQVNSNTIFVSNKLYNLEENYTLHRHSAFINMMENDKCSYFQIAQDSISWQNRSYINDTIEGGLCFKLPAKFSIPSEEIIETLNAQKELILY
jgi:hypothetical protein